MHPRNRFSPDQRSDRYLFASTTAVDRGIGQGFVSAGYEEPERDLRAWGIVLCLLSSLLMIGSVTAIILQVM